MADVEPISDETEGWVGENTSTDVPASILAQAREVLEHPSTPPLGPGGFPLQGKVPPGIKEAAKWAREHPQPAHFPKDVGQAGVIPHNIPPSILAQAEYVRTHPQSDGLGGPADG